jgi:hypothetical protein
VTTFDDTDRRIAAWFTDETVRVPERTIEAALAHARTHPRRRDPLAMLRRDPLSRGPFSGGPFAPVPLLAIVSLIVVAALGGAVAGGFFDRQEPALPSPTPIVPASPSPSHRTLDVDLIEVAGQDASVEITDRSGMVVGAESGQPADGGSVGDGGIDVANDPADPTVIVLTWTGTPCDTIHALDIESDGRRMTLARPRCEGDAVPRDLRLQLRYGEAVDAADISATLVTE